MRLAWSVVVVVLVPAPMVLLRGGVVVKDLRSVVVDPEPMVLPPDAAGACMLGEPALVPGVVVPAGEVPVVSAGGAPGEVVCAIARPIETAAALAIRPLSKVEVFIG